MNLKNLTRMLEYYCTKIPSLIHYMIMTEIQKTVKKKGQNELQLIHSIKFIIIKMFHHNKNIHKPLNCEGIINRFIILITRYFL